jgi:hypothetical protein
MESWLCEQGRDGSQRARRSTENGVKMIRDGMENCCFSGICI